VSHPEFIKGLKGNPSIADKLGMPTEIRAENGTRKNYQLHFGQIDNDRSKTIDITELLAFYGHLDLEKENLKLLLGLCGYDAEGIHVILGRAGLLSEGLTSASSFQSLQSSSEISVANSGMYSSAQSGAQSDVCTALSKVPDEAKRAKVIRQKQRQQFLERMEREDHPIPRAGAGQEQVAPIGGKGGQKIRARERTSEHLKGAGGGVGAGCKRDGGDDDDWLQVSASISSGDGFSLRNSIRNSVSGTNIFERSLAWLDDELLSHSAVPSRGEAISASVGIRASAFYSPPEVRAQGAESERAGRRALEGRRLSVGDRGGRDGGGQGKEGQSGKRFAGSGGSKKRGERGLLVMGAGGGSGPQYTVFSGPSEALLHSGAINDWEFRPP
jgi:hypothetical protein